jgi:hypothetical protein
VTAFKVFLQVFGISAAIEDTENSGLVADDFVVDSIGKTFAKQAVKVKMDGMNACKIS